MARRIAAVAALVLGVAAPASALLFALVHIGTLIVVIIATSFAVACVWIAITRRNVTRLVASVLAVVAVVAVAIGFLVALATAHALRDVAVVVLFLGGAALSARYALGGHRVRAHVEETVPVEPIRHPVLLMNPKSGGGKVGEFHLVEEARRRGIEPVLLGPDDDFHEQAVAAVTRGADALGAAGGDGSQAVVAAVALEHDLPYVCVPAGTRNHLALDLGVDRDDVVGALEAFADGPERRVDVGVVGDRVFVNNVSFGVYGEIVASDEYRDAKVQTVAAMLPELLGPDGRAPELRFTGPDGTPRRTTELVLVSNNPYNITKVGGVGTRERMDTGMLGIVSVRVSDAADAAQLTTMQALGRLRSFSGYDEWTAPTFELDADAPLAAGIDGEFVRVEPPVVFMIRPRALRVRLARDAPGASPAATVARMDRPTLRALLRVVRSGDAAIDRPRVSPTGSPGKIPS
jgi:diacylglycerol kinase family enzyme